MKNEIVGYLNGAINSYTNTISMLTNDGVVGTGLNTLVAIKGEFESLLEVVIDIPENKAQSICSFNIALRNEKLENIISDQKETIENLNDNEKRMYKKLEAYECNDLVWKTVYEELKSENRRLTDGALDKKREETLGRV